MNSLAWGRQKWQTWPAEHVVSNYSLVMVLFANAPTCCWCQPAQTPGLISASEPKRSKEMCFWVRKWIVQCNSDQILPMNCPVPSQAQGVVLTYYTCKAPSHTKETCSNSGNCMEKCMQYEQSYYVVQWTRLPGCPESYKYNPHWSMDVHLIWWFHSQCQMVSGTQPTILSTWALAILRVASKTPLRDLLTVRVKINRWWMLSIYITVQYNIVFNSQPKWAERSLGTLVCRLFPSARSNLVCLGPREARGVTQTPRWSTLPWWQWTPWHRRLW